ncbi:hypothetical protein ANCDUO_17084 [Ancylostoma duodenale]|uniref:Uncharacterized protein n=1 Tax=Ancylostoma duodenale TaxID=51022 RepID=A0A0C2G6X1_9BILA|nr:hypothetical protein ANCDUO_17084 [Ancylostoma duodenale]
MHSRKKVALDFVGDDDVKLRNDSLRTNEANGINRGSVVAASTQTMARDSRGQPGSIRLDAGNAVRSGLSDVSTTGLTWDSHR